jgi:16S rRNA processing protein RimM
MASASRLVLLGEIAGAFGVRGEVKVRPRTETPEGIVAYGPLLDADGKVVLTPKRWRAIKDGLAVIAPEVQTREEAEALRGTRLHVPRDRLPPPAEDEFYEIDLIGCRVEDESGAPLGEVADVLDFGAGQILAIDGPDGARLLHPFTLAAVPFVDPAGGRIVIRPLLDTTD